MHTDSFSAGSSSSLALAAAVSIRAGFLDFNRRFREVTQRAKQRFEQKAWAASRADAVERIGLYDLGITFKPGHPFSIQPRGLAKACCLIVILLSK